MTMVASVAAAIALGVSPMVSWIAALISLPLTFAMDTARVVVAGGSSALALAGVVWLAGLLLVLVRPRV